MNRSTPLIVCVALIATPGVAQRPPIGVDATLARRIHDEVAVPITAALPGWLVGNDPAPAAIETWDSKDGQRLRLTLLYVPLEGSAAKVLEHLHGSLTLVPGARIVPDDLQRRVDAERFAEAITLVQMAKDSWAVYFQRTVVVGDAYRAPILMGTFRSRRGQSLGEFKASVAGRIRGLDPAFDTMLMLALQKQVEWQGDAKVTFREGDQSVTFSAPKGWKRIADGSAVARWEAPKARATIRPQLGSEADAAAFARRWLAEPRFARETDHTPLVLEGHADAQRLEYCYLSLPQEDAPGRWHRVQVRGQAPLYLVYEVAVELESGAESRPSAPSLDAAVAAAFRETTEAKSPSAPRKKE